MLRKLSADDGSAKRRILFGADRHRQHADNHCKCGHQNRPETREAGIDRRGDRIDAVHEALAREGNHQYRIGGRDAHAHDGAGEGRNGERRIAQTASRRSGERGGERGDNDEGSVQD